MGQNLVTMPSDSGIQRLSSIKINILGKEYTVNADDIKPELSLNEYLRDKLFMKGTKNMCLEGGCGACVVVARKTDPDTKKDEVFALNSCLVPLLACNDWKIETVDGIGGPPNEYHTVQKVLADFNGTQCGYCSPGMVMNMYALYESGKLTMKEVENSFGGNICRCTGYRPILAAFKSLCKDADKSILGTFPDIEDVHLCKKKSCQGQCPNSCSEQKTSFKLEWQDSRWIKVFTLAELLKELKNIKDEGYMLIAGNTGKGVYAEPKPSIYIDVKDIPELLHHKIVGDQLILGGNVSLTYAMELFYRLPSENQQFFYLDKLGDHIDVIANVPVRNMGTLAGNLMMKHAHHEFPSDVFLILETVGALLTVVDTDGKEITLSLLDFLNFDMKRKVLKSIILPGLDRTYLCETYKIMPRAQNAHALVNAGFLFKCVHNKIENATIVFGSINEDFTHATKTEAFLVGKDIFDNNVLQVACQTLASEINPDHVLPDPEPEFRKQLAVALFYKAALSMAPPSILSPRNMNAGPKLTRPISTGTQDYETKESLYPLTKAIPKIEALAQTSGHAEYIDDMPDLPHQLHARLVLSEAVPSSEILKMDASEALKHPDIVAFYNSKDIPGENNFMSTDFFPSIEEIFAEKIIKYYSQPIGVLVGKTKDSLTEATPLIKVSYSAPKSKPLLRIPDIIKANVKDKIIVDKKYPAKRKGTDLKHSIKGTFDVRTQYHYHMELQCCRVIPTEDGLEVYPATQWMQLSQVAIAKALDIPATKVTVHVRRCGGGFGGKISRNSQISCAAALAAWKLRKPVSLRMNMVDNCLAIGKRWPVYADYDVQFNDTGVIQYLNCDLYMDYGQAQNETAIDHAAILFRGNYDYDVFDLQTYGTKSDTTGNTWCRAPGTTEGLAAIESIMDHIAYELNMDPLQVRFNNIPKNREILGYLRDLQDWAQIDQRKIDIEQFNKDNRWKKKGIAVCPMTYEYIVFGPHLAVVTISQHDGSVAIAHSGCEIGQGINTKAAQVCAYKLGIPMDKVVMRPTNTFNTNNATATGASATSEGVCYGIIKACDDLLKRLEPYKQSTWEATVTAAFRNYVDLTAYGSYSPKDSDVQNYPIYGVCATEVLLDILTGQYLITRVDLIEDVGQSMSPVIDIGQIEGAFVMGIGYYTSEQTVYNEDGKVLTNRTWNYKPPGAKDIPIDFRVKFPKNNDNPVGVLKSKATGEPSFCLSISVPLAIRNAVASARADADPSKTKWCPFSGPSTVENTFMNCLHDIKQYVF